MQITGITDNQHANHPALTPHDPAPTVLERQQHDVPKPLIAPLTLTKTTNSFIEPHPSLQSQTHKSQLSQTIVIKRNLEVTGRA